MSILDELDNEPSSKPYIDGKPACGIRHAMAEHPELAEEIAIAAKRDDKTATVIASVLRRYGIELSAWQIRYHRRGHCACDS